jgi:hypothetical protein
MSTADDEQEIEDCVYGISKSIVEGSGRSDVIDESSYRYDLSLISCFLPTSEYRGDEGAFKVAVEHLREEIHVGDKSTHENNGHVRGVE